MVGQEFNVNGEVYKIIKLLAKGKGGYSYLAKSKKADVVLKQIHYEPCDYFQFEDNKLSSELRDYETLSKLGIPMPKLLHYDQEKQYIIKEYIPGNTLAQIVADGQFTDDYIAQIKQMCDKLYPNHLNIDYYPTNFVENQGLLYYIDYECGEYSDEWNFENWGIWFLYNPKGMKLYLQTGDQSLLIKDGKPIRTDIMERNGMQREALHRKAFWARIDREWIDEAWYAILAEEYFANKSGNVYHAEEKKEKSK